MCDAFLYWNGVDGSGRSGCAKIRFSLREIIAAHGPSDRDSIWSRLVTLRVSLGTLGALGALGAFSLAAVVAQRDVI